MLIALMLPLTGTTELLEKNFTAYFTSPYSITRYFDKGHNVRDSIEYSKWDSVSRTDVIDRGDSREKVILTDGGAAAPMVSFDGDLKKVEYLKKESRYIPFSFGNNQSSLLIGAGGGKDVIFALLGGSRDIHAVEINSSIIDAVSRYKEFNGDIYNVEGVSLHVMDGRRFVESVNRKFDNIYLSMVMTSSIKNNSMMLAENYIYTEEAFRAYFSRLKEEGKLSFMLHNRYDLFRVLNTGIKVLLGNGTNRQEITRYFAIINGLEHMHNTGNLPKISMPVLIFKKKPFTEDEVSILKTIITEQGRGIIHLPGVIEIGEYRLLERGDYDLDGLIRKIPFNTRPVTDENPFFYNFNKLVPPTISIIILLVLITMIMVIKLSGFRVRDNKILYFCLLGIAYMMVEVPVLSKMALYLGGPSLAFSVVIPLLLASSGLGSLFSNRELFNKNNKYIPLLMSAISISGLILALELARPYTFSGSLPFKVVLISAVVFPAGFFMGMPFPRGITLLKKGREEKIIPLVWGINGLASVLGSTAATAFSMYLGFNITILLGAFVYLILFLLNFWVKFIR